MYELLSRESYTSPIIMREISCLISQLDAAKEENDIENILDKPENMAIINASNWSPTCPITLLSKADLLQELVFAKEAQPAEVHTNWYRSSVPY